MAKIFANKFYSINFYKFYYIKEYNNIYKDQILIKKNSKNDKTHYLF